MRLQKEIFYEMALQQHLAKRLALADGRTMAWREYGRDYGKQDNDGWSVIFFHGNLNSRLFSACWGDKTSEIAKNAGVRVIAVDRPGYGASSLWPWPRSYKEYAGRDVKALAKHLGLAKFSVMGYSSGGPHAIACAHQLSEMVHGLALISSDGPYYKMGAGVMNALYGSPPPYDLSIAMQKCKKNEDALRNAYVAIKSDAKRNIALADLDNAIKAGIEGPAQDMLLETSDWGYDIDQIKTPTVLWHGDKDTDVPLQCAEHLSEALPAADLRVLPGENHSLIRRHWPSIMHQIALFGTQHASTSKY